MFNMWMEKGTKVAYIQARAHQQECESILTRVHSSSVDGVLHE